MEIEEALDALILQIEEVWWGGVRSRSTPSRSLTYPLKSYLLNRTVVFQPLCFGGYVKLLGGKIEVSLRMVNLNLPEWNFHWFQPC